MNNLVERGRRVEREVKGAGAVSEVGELEEKRDKETIVVACSALCIPRPSVLVIDIRCSWERS
jgi:hypothetical protein